MPTPMDFPRLSRSAAELESALAGWLGARHAELMRGIGVRLDVLGVALALVGTRVSRVDDPQAARQRLADPGAAVAQIATPVGLVRIVGGGRLVRGLTQLVLGGPDELPLARPPTPAEQAVWALALAAALEALGAAGEVEPTDLTGREVAPTNGDVLIELEVLGNVRGVVVVVAPAALVMARPRRGLATVPTGPGAAWLDEVLELPVLVARCVLAADEVAALRPRDVLVPSWAAGPGRGRLAVGRGGVDVEMTAGEAPLRVASRYQRLAMDEQLVDDLAVDVTVVAGTVRASARRLLELSPGQVLPLGRRTGDRVELRAGGKVIGDGELIDVDGELAVRVVRLAP